MRANSLARLRWFKTRGYHFRRRVALGPYVVDFLCKEARLIVEADGEHHAKEPNLSHDLARDAWLQSQGYAILRYGNHDIRRNLDGVCEGIFAALRERLSFSVLMADAKGEREQRDRVDAFDASLTNGEERASPHPPSRTRWRPPPAGR